MPNARTAEDIAKSALGEQAMTIVILQARLEAALAEIETLKAAQVEKRPKAV